ncbi:MAG TPA: ABC transporter permease [Vicinamibacterales bacterium]|nr:ABC transporter permease [Vicinamibacterales bacterium]
MTDLRLALRMIARQPGMALLAIVALALGIGLTTTMFSIVNGAVLRGLPFPESDRILHIAPFNIAEQDDVDTRLRTYAEFVGRQTSFEQLAAFYNITANVVGPDGLPERYRGAHVTANTFRLLKVAPVLGRDFRDEEGRPGAEPVVMIGQKVWRERFDADPNVMGRPLRVNGTVMTVVGVMPERFAFPSTHDLWPVLAFDPGGTQQDEELGLEVIGRLRSGVSPEQAGAEFATMWRQLEQAYPERYTGGYTVEIKTYIEEFLGSETIGALFTMLAAVFGVLVIACANVANLVLARAAGRTREIAVRSALGAGRLRVIRQMLVEVLVLAAAGALGGLAIAQTGILLFNRAIVDTRPPFWIDIRIDQTVLLFVTASAAIAAVVAGIVPALRASRMDLAAVMGDESRAVSGLRMGRFTRGLVIVEMALSFGLLVMSALVIQSLVNLGSLDFDFAMRDVWSARVELPDEEYPDEDRRRQAAEAILERLGGLPGAIGVAAATALPIGGPRAAIKLPGREYPTEQDYHDVHRYIVSASFFETLGIRIVDGRAFDARDRAGALPAAIVNESFARKYYQRGVLGERFALAVGPHQEWRTIVGVVPDLGVGAGATNEVPEGIYIPTAQIPLSGMTLLVRTAGDTPLSLTAAVRDAIRQVDPNLPIFNVATVWEGVQAGNWPFRVFGSLFMAFGVAALFLATVGLYGVMAFSVSRRTQEIGVRMAMGAARRDVIAMVLRQGLFQIAAGVIIGVGLAVLLTSAMRILIFGVSPYEPAAFAGVAAVLAFTGLAACYLPARSAAGVDPMIALRHQ